METSSLSKGLLALYWLGILFIVCRTAARRIHLGSFKKFHIDDYIMLFTILTYTGVFVASYQVSINGSSYTIIGSTAETITIEDEKRAILGSKMTFVLEECLIITIWLIKACILMLYSRLTCSLGFWQYTMVKVLAVYCLVGFVVIQILLFGVWCRPFSQYWTVFPENSQCATYYSHMIVTTVFNLSSDLCMLAIPLPIFMKSSMPKRRKIILCVMFSLGIFLILTAILNKYYNFSQKYSLIFLNWYLGEVTTSVAVSNIPLCFPLIRKVFKLDAWGSFSSTGRDLDMRLEHIEHIEHAQTTHTTHTTHTAPKSRAIGTSTVITTNTTLAHERGERSQATQRSESNNSMDITSLTPEEELDRRVELELGLPRSLSDNSSKSLPKTIDDDLESGMDQPPEPARK